MSLIASALDYSIAALCNAWKSMNNVGLQFHVVIALVVRQ